MKKHNTKKFIFASFILIFSLFLSSCSSSVTYSVDKEHEEKIKVIYNMINGLVKDDKDLYLSTFEPSYIENVRKVIDALGSLNNDAKDFNSMVDLFFVQNKQNLEANYGKKFKVNVSFNSVEESSAMELEPFFDDYSVKYELPKNDIQTVVNVSAKLRITGDVYSGNTDCNFILLKINEKWYLHPESFFYAF